MTLRCQILELASLCKYPVKFIPDRDCAGMSLRCVSWGTQCFDDSAIAHVIFQEIVNSSSHTFSFVTKKKAGTYHVIAHMG